MCAYKRRNPNPVVEGGTGVQTLTPYALVCGGSLGANPLHSIGNIGTAGQILTSNGAAAWPTFQNPVSSITSIVGNSGGSQAGPSVTLSGGTSGASFSGSSNTITLSFAGITANNGNVALSTDTSASLINIGTGSGAKGITIGSITTTSSLNLKCGTGNFNLASATGSLLNCTSAGQITKPFHPAFLAYINTTLTSKTGDGTAFTVSFDTKVYDANLNFSSTIFTAPVAGKYHFSCGQYMRNLGLLFTNGNLTLVTTNRNYLICQGNYGALQAGTRVAIGNNVYADMHAGDTASLAIQISGSTKTVDILGLDIATTVASFFSGVLVA